MFLILDVLNLQVPPDSNARHHIPGHTQRAITQSDSMNEVLRLPQDCNKSGDIKLASGVRETMRYLALLPVDIAIDGRYDWNSHEFQFLDKSD